MLEGGPMLEVISRPRRFHNLVLGLFSFVRSIVDNLDKYSVVSPLELWQNRYSTRPSAVKVSVSSSNFGIFFSLLPF